MKISEFLSYNIKCPMCHEPLSLYLVWTGSTTFKGIQVSNNSYRFVPIIISESEQALFFLKNGFIILTDIGQELEIQFSSDELKKYASNYQQHIFYICNPKGAKNRAGQLEINVHTACYYRSTPTLHMKQDKWLELVNPKLKNLVNKREAFALSIKDKNLEKVYITDLDMEDRKTNFWYYTVSDQEKENKFFQPNVLHKTLPLLPNGFKNIEDKDKLISRINTWVLMS